MCSSTWPVNARPIAASDKPSTTSDVAICGACMMKKICSDGIRRFNNPSATLKTMP